MNKYPIIRTIYLYLFALLGLTLLIIGGVRLINLGLKTFIFTQADQEQRMSYLQPPMYYPIEKVEKLQSATAISEDDKIMIAQWLADYKNWQARAEKIDPMAAQRQRDVSMSLAMILIGLPLYLFHWGTIKKDIKSAGV